MTINTIVTPTKATDIPTFPILRQHKQNGRVYMFTAPTKAVLLAHGPAGPFYSEDALGKSKTMCASYDATVYTKCSITLSSKD